MSATSQVIMGVVFLILGCAIYLLFRTKTLNIYQWCSLVGLSDGIDYARIWVCYWNIPDFVRYSLPDGLYCAAYILIMSAIWQNNDSITKLFVIALVPAVTIASEVFQYYGLVNGTFDVMDLACYFAPPVFYMAFIIVKSKIPAFPKQHMKRSLITICLMTLFAIGFTASSVKDDEIDFDSEKFTGKKEKIKSITSVNIMRDEIKNTVWTHTKSDYLWHKLHFKDNSVEQYTAPFSESRKWEYLGSSPYTIIKGHFPDGKEYIAASFTIADSKTSAEFVFTNCHLYISGIDIGVFNNFDIEW